MKKINVLIAMLTITILTGCDEVFSASAAQQKSTYEMQSSKNEANAREIASRNGMPTLTRSLDYENVKRRAVYLNQGNNIGYLYLLTENGQLVRESQVLGKVTSLNTFITPMEEVKIIKHAGDASMRMETPVVISAPDVDGTYGENVTGIFWFTPEGAYQEWNGKYIFSSERLTFQSIPILINQK
jgi:hypothetical protein